MVNAVYRRRARLAARLGLTGIAVNQIKRLITSKVASGEWSPGAGVPCDRDLGAEFGVSDRVIGRCLNELARSGMLKRGVKNWQVVHQ